MRNRYAEVLRTYWRRSTTSPIFGVCIFLYLLVAIVMLAFAGRFRIEQLMFVTMVIGFIGGPFWVHFREQIVDERRRLCPGFVTPHVVIVSILMMLLTVVWPGALMLRQCVHSVGLMAYTTTIMALVGFLVLNPLPFLFIVVTAGWMWLVVGSGFERTAPFFKGGYETSAQLMLMGSVIVIAWTIFRMTAMTEENAAYHRRMRYNTWNLSPRMTGDSNQVWVDAQRSRQFGWPRAGSRIYIPTSTGVWQGARRWLSLNRGSWRFFLFMGICMAGSVELVPRSNSSYSSFPMLGVWLSAFPGMAVFGSWLQRWRFLEAELLRPIARDSFLKQVALAIATNVLQAWSMMALALIAVWFIFERSRIGGSVMVNMLGVSLLFQLPGFGVSAWMLRHRSAASMIAGILPAVILSSFVLAPISDPSMAAVVPFLLIVAAIFGAVGIGFARNAYRHWLVTELG